MSGEIKAYNGASFNWKPIKVWNGSAWAVKPLKYWNGSEWKLTNNEVVLTDAIPTNINYRFIGSAPPPSTTVNWYVPKVNDYLLLRIEFCHTEANFDFLKIYQGSDNTGTLLYTFDTSSNIGISNNTVNSWYGDLLFTTDIFIEFTNDGGGGGEGFELNIYDQNHKFLLSDATLSIGDTLDYPIGTGDYLPSQYQRWWIAGSLGKQIQLNFSAFNTEANFDFLKIYNGSSPFVGNLIEARSGTGGTTLNSITSEIGNGLFLHFNSDGGVNGTGFVFSVNSI